MKSISPLQSLVLDLPPSCIEFWPLDTQYAVVGTYNLEKQPTNAISDDNEPETENVGEQKTQERNGSVILLKLVGDQVSVFHHLVHTIHALRSIRKIIQTLSTPFAVLDIHFVHAHQPQSLFGVASSTGSIGLFQLVDDIGNSLDSGTSSSITPRIVHVQTYQVTDPNILVTAFIWSPRISKSKTGLTACMSLSDGTIGLGEFEPHSAAAEVNLEQVTEHELEAWTIALAPDGMGIYSGGDDSALKFTDIAQFVAVDSTPTPQIAWEDKKSHFAGVTAILPLKTTLPEALIITGSYDDTIRLLSTTPGTPRKVLAEMNLGGGVWRLKQLDLQQKETTLPEGVGIEILLLVSCMHAGARIIKLHRGGDAGEWEFEVIAQFTEHKSMNYGSDSQPDVNEQGQRTFVTTSFYDRLLCLWRY